MPDRQNIPGLGAGARWALAGAVGLACGVAVAQGDPAAEGERPSGANRVVRVFDFEEAGSNPLPVPFGWIRAQNDPAVPRERPGFPIWNRAEFDSVAPAVSGGTTLRMPAEGGSTSLRLLSGLIAVFPGTDYRITAKVRTDRMVHARAVLAGRLLDQGGQPIASTEAYSRAVRTMGEWTEISVVVAGLDDRAAYLQPELLVLQPEKLPGADLDRAFGVWEQDFHANAWFDDVTVTLLPRLELDTGAPGQVIGPDERPEVRVLIRDLTGEHMAASVLFIDADGRAVAEHPMQPGSGRLTEVIRPDLPGPGWYRAVLLVRTGTLPVGEAVLDFAWGAPEDAKSPAPGFGLRASGVRPERAAALDTVAAWSGVGHATVGVWDESQGVLSVAPGENRAFETVRSIITRGLDVTVALDETPADLAVLVGKDPWDVAGALASDEKLWLPWLEPALDKFGQGVLSWQIGDRVLGMDPALTAQRVNAAGSVIERWVPGPEVRTPWGVGDEIDPVLVQPGRGLVVLDDGAGSDESLERLIEGWASAASGVGEGPDRATLTIEFPSSTDGRVSREALGKLARRVVGAWSAAHRAGVWDRVGFSLREPWRVGGGHRPMMMPSPELSAWRTLASVMGGRGSVRELDLLPGVRTVLAGEGDDGVLIAWLTDADAPVRTLELPLSTGPVRVIDLMGPRREVGLTEDSEIGMSWHRVPLTREPVMIEGVRTELVEFLASVRLTPGRLEPVLGLRTHELELRNPWSFPVRGKVFIVEPGGLSRGVTGRDRTWTVSPRVVSFSVDAGKTLRRAVELQFGAGQESGWIPAVLDVQLSADEEYPVLRVDRRMELASDTLGVELVARRLADGGLVIDALVTNRGGDAVTIDLAAIATGTARERATMNGLTPGETAGRRFVMSGVEPGQRVSVSLSESKSGTRLLRSVLAP